MSDLKYQAFIEDNLQIVNKKQELVDFKLNPIQSHFINKALPHNTSHILLKARQQGFSSLITGMFTADFILTKNSYNVTIADIEENAEVMLEKVKGYIRSYEEKNKFKIKFKYNSRTELYFEFMNSWFVIGTAKNTDFGRSRTITNLHCSEVAFYADIQRIIAGAGQAVAEGGLKIMETTANGFNDFKTLYQKAQRQENGYNAHFYKASDFYEKSFLDQKREELGRLFAQEYPENDIEAFLTSGDCFFDVDALKSYHKRLRHPIASNSPIAVHGRNYV